MCKMKERGEENYRRAENEVEEREKGRQRGTEGDKGICVLPQLHLFLQLSLPLTSHCIKLLKSP